MDLQNRSHSLPGALPPLFNNLTQQHFEYRVIPEKIFIEDGFTLFRY